MVHRGSRGGGKIIFLLFPLFCCVLKECHSPIIFPFVNVACQESWKMLLSTLPRIYMLSISFLFCVFLDDDSFTFPGCARLETKARPQQQGLGTRLNSAPCLLEAAGGCRQKIRKQHSDPVVAPQGNMMPFRTLHSSPRLSELMQRNPLPTILGSPSRVRSFFLFVCP